MVTRLDLFKKEMEPAKELYTREILNFTKKYDSLGKMTIMEEPDIDTQEYIYSFEKLNGTSKRNLMKSFQKSLIIWKSFLKSMESKDFVDWLAFGYEIHLMQDIIINKSYNIYFVHCGKFGFYMNKKR